MYVYMYVFEYGLNISYSITPKLCMGGLLTPGDNRKYLMLVTLEIEGNGAGTHVSLQCYEKPESVQLPDSSGPEKPILVGGLLTTGEVPDVSGTRDRG